jgi:hypothetical protein
MTITTEAVRHSLGEWVAQTHGAPPGAGRSGGENQGVVFDRFSMDTAMLQQLKSLSSRI